MRNSSVTAVLLLLASIAPLASGAVTPGENLPKLEAHDQITLKGENLEPLYAADRARAKNGQPIKYSAARDITDVQVKDGQSSMGAWTQTKSGDWIWRMSVMASGASSLDFGFENFFLPNGAALHIYDSNKQLLRGPFTDQQNNAAKTFWTPVVPGPEAVIELFVPAHLRQHVSLSLTRVNYGYRFFTDEPFALNKSQSCNVDVACPEGTPFRNQIRSVAGFTEGQSRDLCSGALVNTTAGDSTPYFLTADHCGITDSVAQNLVFYFNYQSAECRQGDASGIPLPRSDFEDVITGASLVATYGPSDFTLLRLSSPIPPSFNAYFSGWDRTGNALQSAYSIHHPGVDEKRISIENDPVSNATTTNAVVGWAPDTHFEIEQWDVGITEGGSSGSPLFDQNNRIVGQLTGGAIFSCPGAEEGLDYYGLIEVSWDGGGTSSSRLRDWLDPAGTNPTTLDGQNGCVGTTASIQSTKGALARVGEVIDFSASLNGGQSPFVYDWDVDGDGNSDSQTSTAQAIYHQAFSGNVVLTVTDATGCSSSTDFGLVVEAPAVQLSQVGEPAEMCGDGDTDIDPGEAWRFPVSLINTGGTTPADTFAAFSAAGGPNATTKRFGGPDNFGYTFADSQETTCNFSFQDISSTGTELPFTQANSDQGIPALDDGFSDVDLGTSGFDFYGQNITRVTVSTNGYLSTDLNDNGGDFSNDCPLPSTGAAGGNNGRIYPLHDDVIANAVYHQYFPNCPRPGESVGSAGCDIFQWNVDGFFNSTAGLNFDFQAILYEGTNQIVYQYGPGNERNGASQSVGIQNRPGTSAADIDGLNYACETAGSVPDNSAVCIFHPSADSPGVSGDISLLSSAPSIGVISNGAASQVDVTVQVNETFSCGDSFTVDYLGAVHSDGFSATGSPSAISGQVPQDCNVVTSCRNIGDPAVQAREGFWFNPLRPGNGIDLHFAGDALYSAWYTAESDRSPLWYYVTSVGDQSLVNNSVDADILRFTLNGDITQTSPTSVTVGEAQISFVSDSEAVMTFTIDGESSGELIRFFDLTSTADVDPVITDQYFNAEESGWGIGTHRQGNQEFSAVYFYDTDGQPRWVVVTSDGTTLTNQGTADLASFKAHCPGCTWTPVSILNGGTMERTLNADGSALLDALDVRVDDDVTIEWNRSGLPLQQITPPN